MSKRNIWLCSDYVYHYYNKPTVLPSIHPERADKMRMFGLAGGMTILGEHVLKTSSGETAYIAYEWVDWSGKESAYITFALEPNDMIACGYYMRILGMSGVSWLCDRMLLPMESDLIGVHQPLKRDGQALWTQNPTLEGILEE